MGKEKGTETVGHSVDEVPPGAGADYFLIDRQHGKVFLDHRQACQLNGCISFFARLGIPPQIMNGLPKAAG
ncbi:hypothetical protein NtRootA1_28780 [Arthrobacter sp. NtRootA1]|nr:hypothetical protein NtRootA1_28780 [Arthrobacter sp. NtRootA1]